MFLSYLFRVLKNLWEFDTPTKKFEEFFAPQYIFCFVLTYKFTYISYNYFTVLEILPSLLPTILFTLANAFPMKISVVNILFYSGYEFKTVSEKTFIAFFRIVHHVRLACRKRTTFKYNAIPATSSHTPDIPPEMVVNWGECPVASEFAGYLLA